MCRQLPLVSHALLLLRVAPLFGSISNLVVQGTALLLAGFFILSLVEKDRPFFQKVSVYRVCGNM